MKIKINIELFMLYVIMISLTSLFGIVKLSSDFILIECVLFILYVEIKYCKVKVNEKYKFKWIILFIIPLIIMSTLRSYKLYGQAIILGIRAQRMLFVLYFMYFPLSKLFKIGKINKEQIEKMIYFVGTIQLILFTVFFISKGKISCLKYDYDYRYGSIRLRENCCIINLLFVLTINNYINSKEKNKNLFLIIFNIGVCAVIIKTRLLIASYICVLLFALLLWKKNLRKKMFIAIVVLLSIPLIVNSTIIKDMIDTIFEDDEDDIRKIGKAYYIEQLKYSPLTGRGYINTQCERAVIAAGMSENIYLVDNGIYGLAFIYGIIGIGWFAILWIKLLVNAIKNYRIYNNYIVLLYLIHITILLPNIIWWIWTKSGILMLIINFIFCDETKKIKQ